MKIIKIAPAEEYFSITWNIGKRCNYDCMYCPPSLHDNSSPHKSLAQLQAYWTDMYDKTHEQNRPYKISFTGGEVSANKDFLKFVQWLKTTYPVVSKILVTSNGSATYKYYSSLFEYVDNLSLSTHSEHINEQKFFDTVLKLKQNLQPNKHLHVNIMNEFWNTDRTTKYKEFLDQHDISNMINEINYSAQTREIPILKGSLNLAFQ